MKNNKRITIAAILILILAVLLTIFIPTEKKQIKKVVKEELNHLKHMDKNTVSEYISYQELFPDAKKEEPVSEEIAQIFPLFFKDFSFRILKVSADEKQAKVTVRLNTIDAKTLAKDYMKATMKKRIASSANPQSVEYSLEDYYLLLGNLLKTKTYETLEVNTTMVLNKKNESWVLEHNNNLDNELVGNFVTYLADPNLFTPEEIVKIHFDTIKDFDSEQLNRYLKIDSLFDVNDSYSHSITQALCAQIHEYFDYQVISEEDDGETAKVICDITSCDFKTILTTYENDLSSYLATSKALEDGTSGRLNTANKLLLKSIQANTSSSTTSITLQLKNDGSSWKLQMSEEVAQAILGNIGSAVAEISSDVK